MSVNAKDSSISRRALLAGSALILSRPDNTAKAATTRGKLKATIFSKHLQFVEGDELAVTAAGLGFDGVDITVRGKGHIEPATVAKDLPALVGTLRKHGLE